MNELPDTRFTGDIYADGKIYKNVNGTWSEVGNGGSASTEHLPYGFATEENNVYLATNDGTKIATESAKTLHFNEDVFHFDEQADKVTIVLDPTLQNKINNAVQLPTTKPSDIQLLAQDSTGAQTNVGLGIGILYNPATQHITASVPKKVYAHIITITNTVLYFNSTIKDIPLESFNGKQIYVSGILIKYPLSTAGVFAFKYLSGSKDSDTTYTINISYVSDDGSTVTSSISFISDLYNDYSAPI